jgi:hypothetical protein
MAVGVGYAKILQYQTDSHKTRRCGQRVRTKVRTSERVHVLAAVASAGVAGQGPRKAGKPDTITGRFRIDFHILRMWRNTEEFRVELRHLVQEPAFTDV